MNKKHIPRFRRFTAGILLTKISCLSPSQAQLVDETQVEPTVALGTIGKSLEEQIGVGRGDNVTPQSSIYVIERDRLDIDGSFFSESSPWNRPSGESSQLCRHHVEPQARSRFEC